MWFGLVFNRKKGKIESRSRDRDEEISLEEKLKLIDRLDASFAKLEREQMRIKSGLELKLREADRKRRAKDRMLEHCNNEIEAKLYRKEIDGYVQIIDELKERLNAIIARIAKIRRIRIKLDLLKTDIEAVLESNIFEAIERFIQIFSKEDIKEFEKDLDYQLDRLNEELDRVLMNMKEKEYTFWLDEEVDKEKEKESVSA